MKKIYFEGKEVKMGETITKSVTAKDDLFGEMTTSFSVEITESILPVLIKVGIVEVKEEECIVNKDFNYYLEKIAKRQGWNINKALSIFNNVYSIYPMAIFGLFLREIAIDLDKKYEDHIQDSPEIFVVSSLDGRITKANKASIKNYRNFAAFRSIEDAKTACKVLRTILKDMYARK